MRPIIQVLTFVQILCISAVVYFHFSMLEKIIELIEKQKPQVCVDPD